MITKQDAAILFAYSFKLVDKEGKEWEIFSVNITSFHITDQGNMLTVFFNQIGTDYWILKRPYSQLVETIQHEGRQIVPLEEIEKCMKSEGIDRYIMKEVLYWITDPSITNQMPYCAVVKLYSLHFIDLPKGTYREMD